MKSVNLLGPLTASPTRREEHDHGVIALPGSREEGVRSWEEIVGHLTTQPAYVRPRLHRGCFRQ